MAGSLDITNGHAARMRFSRFKQQMEGIPTQTRKPKTSAPRSKEKQKQDKIGKLTKSIRDEEPLSVKQEPHDRVESMHAVEEKVPTSLMIKPEPKEEKMEDILALGSSMATEQSDQMSFEPKLELENPSFALFGEAPVSYEMAYTLGEVPMVKLEPEVKVEPHWDE